MVRSDLSGWRPPPIWSPWATGRSISSSRFGDTRRSGSRLPVIFPPGRHRLSCHAQLNGVPPPISNTIVLVIRVADAASATWSPARRPRSGLHFWRPIRQLGLAIESIVRRPTESRSPHCAPRRKPASLQSLIGKPQVDCQRAPERLRAKISDDRHGELLPIRDGRPRRGAFHPKKKITPSARLRSVAASELAHLMPTDPAAISRLPEHSPGYADSL